VITLMRYFSTVILGLGVVFLPHVIRVTIQWVKADNELHRRLCDERSQQVSQVATNEKEEKA